MLQREAQFVPKDLTEKISQISSNDIPEYLANQNGAIDIDSQPAFIPNHQKLSVPLHGDIKILSNQTKLGKLSKLKPQFGREVGPQGDTRDFKVNSKLSDPSLQMQNWGNDIQYDPGGSKDLDLDVNKGSSLEHFSINSVQTNGAIDPSDHKLHVLSYNSHGAQNHILHNQHSDSHVAVASRDNNKPQAVTMATSVHKHTTSTDAIISSLRLESFISFLIHSFMPHHFWTRMMFVCPMVSSLSLFSVFLKASFNFLYFVQRNILFKTL